MVARWALKACVAVALVVVLAVSGPVPTGLAAQCEIWPRFLVLAEALPDLIGNCMAPESLNGETGDIEQPVDGGVLVLRSADNTPVFTDGWQTWVAGPNGIETRLNSERLAWEPGEASLAAAADTVPIPVRVPAWGFAGGKPGGGNGAHGSGAGEFSSPSGIAVDGKGAVWVTESFNHRIQVREPDGRWRVAGGNPAGGANAGGSGAGEFSAPRGIAVDGKGAVWVTDTGNHRIQRFGVE